MLLIFLHYQHSFPQLAFPEKPRQQATFTPHPAKGTPECAEVSNYRPLPAFEWVTTLCCGSSHSGCTPRRAASVKGGEAAEPCEGPLDGSEHRGQMAVR